MSLRVELLRVTAKRIYNAKALDPITVTTWNPVCGQGSLTVECYGRAWNCYWGAMGNKTVEEFVECCSADYIATCLMRSNRGVITSQKAAKEDEAYLLRIVYAVQEALKLSVDITGNGCLK